ncbi:MAG TPA: gliding motility lipoprotein GldH [Chitinophagaceae bacterium]|nr:gliding motility lipoprotein GldH [Chitinophagaceae bacterium]
MMPIRKILLCFVPCALLLTACQTIDLYEKTATIPRHQWKSSFKPSFTFIIKDTTPTYEVFLTVRHKDKYNYNNIWLNVSVQMPGSDTVKKFRIDKQLGSDENGWLGSGMDDIYEHEISLVKELVENEISFRKKGEYTFTIEQVMREDPLENILNIGLRIEKQQP